MYIFNSLKEKIEELNANCSNPDAREQATKLKRKLAIWGGILTYGTILIIVGTFVAISAFGSIKISSSAFTAIMVCVTFVLIIATSVGAQLLNLSKLIMPRSAMASAIELTDSMNSTCPKCGNSITFNENFCSKCGHQVRKTCPNCHHNNKTTSLYCEHCGKQLDN